LIFVYVFGLVKNCTELVLFGLKVNKLIENHTFIKSRISFKAITMSLQLELKHNMLVSSANKIGFEGLFNVKGKLLMYTKKSNDPRIEPCGTPCLIFFHSETPPEELLFVLFNICLSNRI
jgi:hypothetical protein